MCVQEEQTDRYVLGIKLIPGGVRVDFLCPFIGYDDKYSFSKEMEFKEHVIIIDYSVTKFGSPCSVGLETDYNPSGPHIYILVTDKKGEVVKFEVISDNQERPITNIVGNKAVIEGGEFHGIIRLL